MLKRTSPRWRRGLTGLTLAALAGIGGVASAATTPKPSVAAGFTITKLAAIPAVTNCDDLTFLDGNLFVGCQNATLSAGGGGSSTVAEISPAGKFVRTISVKDKIDGMAGDPRTHKLVLTLNEDGNSHMVTIDPAAGQITQYAYSPNPQSASAPASLHTGGGTDTVSVDASGHIFITGSHARVTTGSAVFGVTLTPPAAAGGTGTAALSPTWSDNATAANGNTGSGTVKLALKDVDSGAIVPASSPRFGGAYVIDDQTALTLVFASELTKGTGLTALKTPYGIDDLLWATSAGGSLYVVDNGGTAKGASSIYKVTGPFTPNTVLGSNDSLGDQVVKIDLTTGKLTPFVQHLTTTKGLVYVNPDGTQTQLTLNGVAAGAATTNTSGSKKSGGSSNTGLIIVVVVLAVLGGGALLARRRQADA